MEEPKDLLTAVKRLLARVKTSAFGRFISTVIKLLVNKLHALTDLSIPELVRRCMEERRKDEVSAKPPTPADGKSLMGYKIFIATAGGLENERRIFHEGIKCANSNHCEERGVLFGGKGWEDVPPGYGNAQEIINKTLRQCHFFVLIFWDRWGTRPYAKDDRYSSGCEAEYYEAVSLIESGHMKNIAVFFKNDIEPDRLKSPDDQLQQVLNFKNKLKNNRNPYFKEFTTSDELQRELSTLFAGWARELGQPLEAPKHSERNIIGSDSFDPDVTE